jgi:hypothetical protein
MRGRVTGQYLNDLWGVGAAHALYSHGGTWHHQLKALPGALFDSTYSEAHHLRRLGAPHDGPDEQASLICVCPTCHVQLDYAARPLALDRLRIVRHELTEDCVAYHNDLYAPGHKSERGPMRPVDAKGRWSVVSPINEGIENG